MLMAEGLWGGTEIVIWGQLKPHLFFLLLFANGLAESRSAREVSHYSALIHNCLVISPVCPVDEFIPCYQCY